ncbi:type 2 isopentenyl-diphosphate Delta-isomerase [Candidatus Dojkabacteria bacterium]|nr:type 2 isopentenyl-diphosphate Delta-isomerase [Candidatus Dojkabacteria bacterium]
MAQIHNRKKQHIEIIQNNPVEPFPSSFDFYRLPFKALPEIDMLKIDTSTKFLGFDLSFPFLISSMTGGEKYGSTINRNIALAAENEKVGFGLGSMRIIDKYPEAVKTFDVKRYCPSVPMFANLGLVQLNYGFTYEKIQKLIDLVNADGIFLHLNHLQEAIQPEGTVNFESLLPKLEAIVKKLKVPVIIKEAGHGIDKATVEKLLEVGVKWIDVSGTGGTSWAWIESYRSKDGDFGEIFKYEGIPTAECLENLNQIKINKIAGGGIRKSLHIAKSIALGTKLAKAAKPFMHAALKYEEEVIKIIKRMKKELIIAMFSAGCSNLADLSNLKLDKIHPQSGMKI